MSRAPVTALITWPSCASCTRSTTPGRAPRPTTPVTAVTGRSTSAPATAHSCGRCWTRRPGSGWRSCTRGRPWARCRGTSGVSCSWTSGAKATPGRSWRPRSASTAKMRSTSSRCYSSVPADTASFAPSAPTSPPAAAVRTGVCGSCVSPGRRRRRCSGWCSTVSRWRSRQAISTASPTSSAPRCATSPRWCRRTGRSPRRRSPRRRSRCVRATAPIMRSRSAGSGPIRSARPRGGQRSARTGGLRGFATSKPSARS